MGVFEKMVGMFAKKKGKQLAKKFDKDPKIQKEIEELDKIWSELEDRGKKLSDSINDYLESE